MNGAANDAAVMTDAELDRLRTDCYAEGRKDAAEAAALQIAVLRNALKDIYAEVAGKAPPTHPSSYLPPKFVEQIAEAIRLAEQEIV